MKKDKVDGTISDLGTDHLSRDEIIEIALLKNISGGGCSKMVDVPTCGQRAGNIEGDNSCWRDTCYKQVIVDIPD